MSRSRSRERHTKRYRGHTKRRRSYSLEDDDRIRKKSNYYFSKYDNNNNSHHNNYYYQQNNHDEQRIINNNYYYHHHHHRYNDNYNDNHHHNHHHNHNHNHYHNHYHNHNHNHHHYHHHHHHNNNKNRRESILHRGENENIKLESESHGFSISGDDTDHDDDDNNNDDLEGTVCLKNISSIYKMRYEIGCKLGQGTFGSVIECIDNKRKIRVAVKIVRAVRRYLDAAEIEVDILNKLDELDIYKNSLIIRLYKSFRCEINNKEHSCLVFEKCGRSLYDYIKKNKYKGFDIKHVGIIGYQLFHSISFCHLNKLTHTDLKLENILFVSDDYYYDKKFKLYLPSNSFEIRLIDFGGATFECDHHSSIINTRQYRGPEVILNLSWSYPSDIWSAGCILYELYCGELLFATHEDIEHLQLIQKILNIKQFPINMINKQNNNLLSSSSSQTNYIEKCKKLRDQIFNDKLFDLINKCLQIDPNKRITAIQAKKHPFFQQFRNNNNNNEQNIQFNKIYNMINKNNNDDNNNNNNNNTHTSIL